MLWILYTTALLAEDWPEWRGRGRTGVWNESGLMDRFPSEGLRESWRVPVQGGYSGPAVSRGRVFVTGYAAGIERALAFDEASGKPLWTNEWPAGYRGLEYPGGPRATPTADGDRVYVLGAMGELRCLRVRDGSLVWRADFVRDFAAEIPTWGTAGAPLVFGDLLIAIVGGKPESKVVAFDKRTGAVRWRALRSDSEPGYSQPVLADGSRIAVWHAGAVSMLDAASGRVFWEHPYAIKMNTPIATPVIDGKHLLVTAFFQGARLLKLDSGELLWRGNSESEISSETIHAAITTPVIDGGYVYGICAYGQLRCLKLSTGERVWESLEVTRERARNATAFIVRNGQRYLFYNDRGELISGHLSPEGYRESSRVKLIEPTSIGGGRRELKAVNWVHPAFANGHVVVRNDREMVRFSLRRSDR